jgi:hypothetical protein
VAAEVPVKGGESKLLRRRKPKPGADEVLAAKRLEEMAALEDVLQPAGVGRVAKPVILDPPRAFASDAARAEILPGVFLSWHYLIDQPVELLAQGTRRRGHAVEVE